MANSDLIAAYQARFNTFGPSSEAVQYADRKTHFARFEILAGVDPSMKSVLDVGCGLADFCQYLRACGNKARYRGIDVVPEFVSHAQSVLADDPLASVSLGDAEEDLPRGYDYVILSGVFNNVMEDNDGFMRNTLRRMFDAAEKGIAFNAMSVFVDYRDPDLFYADPMDIFAFCKSEFGGYPVLRHDYVTRLGGFPYEFAMYVYKSPRTFGAL